MIVFKNIRYKNFLSVGSQFVEVTLNSHPTTLSHGTNGSGKSSLLDAICFGLFNKPFRNVTKGKLVNSINQKNCLVELELSIGQTDYKIVRGIKPNIFEIHKNGTLIDQDAAARDYQEYLEDSILKLNYRSFTQIVILGSATFSPFMQLPAASRREIIEDLLDIKVFSGMNKIAKEKLSVLKQDISQSKIEIEARSQKLKNQESFVAKLEADEKSKIDSLEDNIKDSEMKVNAYQKEIDMLVKEAKDINSTITDKKQIRASKSELQEIRPMLDNKLKKLKTDIKFYSDNDNCPTCKQSITTEHKDNEISKKQSKVLEIENGLADINSKIDELNKRLSVIEEIEGKISVLSNKINTLESNKDVETRLIKNWTKQIAELGNNAVNLKDESLKIPEMQSMLELEEKKYNSLNEEMTYLSTCISLLKDNGIKSTIISRYLPVINKLINKFLQEMDFFVQFELDEEFNETIKSRHRDDFVYASFSEGQKSRINLAILFTWRAIAKMRNTSNTNLLIMDEVFDGSLDIDGTDFVMRYLSEVSQNSNVFVISHKESLFDKFSRLLKYRLVNNYTEMEVE